jgi:hypothetical protein
MCPDGATAMDKPVTKAPTTGRVVLILDGRVLTPRPKRDRPRAEPRRARRSRASA